MDAITCRCALSEEEVASAIHDVTYGGRHALCRDDLPDLLSALFIEGGDVVLDTIAIMFAASKDGDDVSSSSPASASPEDPLAVSLSTRTPHAIDETSFTQWAIGLPIGATVGSPVGQVGGLSTRRRSVSPGADGLAGDSYISGGSKKHSSKLSSSRTNSRSGKSSTMTRTPQVSPQPGAASAPPAVANNNNDTAGDGNHAKFELSSNSDDGAAARPRAGGGFNAKGGDRRSFAEALDALIAEYSEYAEEIDDEVDDTAIGLVEEWASLSKRRVIGVLRDVVAVASSEPTLAAHMVLQRLQHRAHEEYRDRHSRRGVAGTTDQLSSSMSLQGARAVVTTQAEASSFVSIMAAQHLDRSPTFTWSLDSALLFIDISGYSRVASVLAKTNPYELSRVVNIYFGMLLSVARMAGGDVVKFAGDAVLVTWHHKDYSLARNLRAAIACAVELNEKCNNFAVPPAGSFGIHIGVAVGRVSSRIMIPSQASNATAMPAAFHFLSGVPLAEVSEACGLAARDEIVMHRNALKTLLADPAESRYGIHVAPVGLDSSAVPIVQSATMVEDDPSTAPAKLNGTTSPEEASDSNSPEFYYIRGIDDVVDSPDDAPSVSGPLAVSTATAAAQSPQDDAIGKVTSIVSLLDDTVGSPAASMTSASPNASMRRKDSRHFRGPTVGRRRHFVPLPHRPGLANTSYPWFRRQGNPLAACVRPSTVAAENDGLVGVVVDELLFIPPRVSEQIAIGTDPLLMAQMRDLIVLFVRMGDSQADAAHADSDPAVWFTEVHAVLRDHGCAVVQVIDDDKGVHVVAAFNLYTINGDAAERCIDAVAELRRRRSRSFVGAAAGTVFCGVIGHSSACQWDITGTPCVRACRLMQHGVKTNNPIVLDESVYVLANDRSKLEVLTGEEIFVKGTDGAVAAFSVTADRQVVDRRATAFNSFDVRGNRSRKSTTAPPMHSFSNNTPDAQPPLRGTRASTSVAVDGVLPAAAMPCDTDEDKFAGSESRHTTKSPVKRQTTEELATWTPTGPKDRVLRGGSTAVANLNDVVDMSVTSYPGGSPHAGVDSMRSPLKSTLSRRNHFSVKPPVLHFSHTLSKFVMVDQIQIVRDVLSYHTDTLRSHQQPTAAGGGSAAAVRRRTVVVRGPPATGKFGVILNALEGTGFVPLVHTAEEHDRTLSLVDAIATWFAASINRHVAAAAMVVLDHLDNLRTTAAFEAGIDLVRSVVSRKFRVAVIVRRSQYLDDGSANFLRVLHNQFGTAPTLALLLTTSPSVQNELTHAVFAVPPLVADPQDNSALSATDGATHVYVETVPRDEAAAIVCHCMKGRVEEETVDWIFAKSAGALGWIVELCGYLQARGHVNTTMNDTLAMKRSVRRTLDSTSWNLISAPMTVKVMQIIDQLDPTLLMMCKIVAAITEQPGISAFYYSVNRVAQIMIGRELDVKDIKYMQKLYILRECEHKCSGHADDGKLNAAMFFFPPMRDVVAGLLTVKQRAEINAVCADAYSDTHPMNHPTQYLVRARHYLFCDDRDSYENDIERGWELIPELPAAEQLPIKDAFIEWSEDVQAPTARRFMSDDDYQLWRRQKQASQRSGRASSRHGTMAPSAVVSFFGQASSPHGSASGLATAAFSTDRLPTMQRSTRSPVAPGMMSLSTAPTTMPRNARSPGMMSLGGAPGGLQMQISLPTFSSPSPKTFARSSDSPAGMAASMETSSRRPLTIFELAKWMKPLSYGPARDYLDAVLAEVLALSECVTSAEARLTESKLDEHRKRVPSTGAASTLIPVATASPAFSVDDENPTTSSTSGAASLEASRRAGGTIALDANNNTNFVEGSAAVEALGTVPTSVVQRYKNALSDYKIILLSQAEPITPDPDDGTAETLAADEDQEALNVEIATAVQQIADRFSAHLKGPLFQRRVVRDLAQPPTDERIEAAQKLVAEVSRALILHVQDDFPMLQRLFESHQRSALWSSIRQWGAAITSRTEDAVGPKVYHVKRVERVRSEDEVADGIAHAVDAFAASGDELTSDTSTLVVLYGHLPQVLDAYCRSSRRLRDSFVEGLRGFYESMFAMESVRRRTREEFFVFLALWVSCCREREC